MHEGVHSVAEFGQPQLTGDVTFSEGASIALTQVGNDIAIAFTGAGIPASLIPLVDCTLTLGEDVTPLRWNGLASCGLIHVENRANLNALVIGDVAEEGGDIIIYEDAAGNISFQVDADAADVTIGDADTELGLLTIYGKNATTLSLGDATHEGGDIIVYSDAAGGIAFQVDADAISIGIGVAPVANTNVTMSAAATDVTILSIVDAADYSGSATNYGLNLTREVAAGDVAVAMLNYASKYSMTCKRDINNSAGSIQSFSNYFDAADSGNIEGTTSGKAREIYGTYCNVTQSGTDSTSNSNSFRAYAGYFKSNVTMTENKGGGAGYIANYGVYIDVDTNPTVTLGTVVPTSYGVWVDVDGTAAGISTAYGIYVSATGADANWSGYFLDSTVGIGVDGSLANLTALQFGSTTKEGGNIIVYQDLAGTITFQVDADLPAVQGPYWTGDYGPAWAGLALPAAPNGSLHLVYNSNAGVLATRLYGRSNGVWVSVAMA